MAKFKRLLTAFLLVSLLTHCASTSKTRSIAQVFDDESIAFSLKTKYMRDKVVPAKDILIGVWKGMVTLKGEIEQQEQINRAIEIAEQQKGVKEVKAFLVLKQYGKLQESHKKPFFKRWFKKGQENSASKNNNKTALREKDLVDESADKVIPKNNNTELESNPLSTSQGVATEPPDTGAQIVTEGTSESDNLDHEEEF